MHAHALSKLPFCSSLLGAEFTCHVLVKHSDADFMEVVKRSRVEGVSLQAAREGDIIVGGTLVVTAYILHQEDSWGR